MTIFILVHGTWAKHSPWTLPDSQLRKHIEARLNEAGQSAFFELVPWGGHNFGRSRLAAADKIAEHVKALHSANEDEQIFLIGHSHGGSAIAYFLKHYPTLAKRITGTAFLSTPFVATRLRPRCTSLLDAILFAFGILVLSFCCSVFSIIETIAASLFVDSFDPLDIVWPISILVSSLLVGVLLVYFPLRKVRTGLRQYVDRTLPGRLSDVATVNIPAGNYIYLRAMGDEAAGILSVAHLASWFINVIGAVATIPIICISALWRRLTSTRTGTIIGVISVSIFPVWIVSSLTMIVYGPVSCAFAEAMGGKPIDCRYTLYSIVFPGFTGFDDGVSGLWFNAMAVLSPLFVICLALMLAYSVILLFVLSVSTVWLALFGWLGPGLALFGDLAVEPTPEGAVTLMHVDWEAGNTESILALNHSRTYVNPDALKYIATWIIGHLMLHSQNVETARQTP